MLRRSHPQVPSKHKEARSILWSVENEPDCFCLEVKTEGRKSWILVLLQVLPCGQLQLKGIMDSIV